MDAATQFATTVVVGVVSGALGAALAARAERRLARSAQVRNDVDDGLAALGALRSAYRLCARRDPAAPGENALADLEDVLCTAAARLTAPVVTVVDLFVGVGRLYSALDPDTGAAAEEAAFREARDAFIAERKAYQP